MLRCMTITHIDVVSLPVQDQERARDFYVGTLGFDLVRQNEMGPGQQWIQVAPPGGQTSITLVTWFDTMPAGSLQGLVLHTDDIDAQVAELISPRESPCPTACRPPPGAGSSCSPTRTATGSCCRGRAGSA